MNHAGVMHIAAPATYAEMSANDWLPSELAQVNLSNFVFVILFRVDAEKQLYAGDKARGVNPNFGPFRVQP